MTAALSHTWRIGARQLRNIVRQPWYIATSLVQPAIWLLLYGALFSRVAEIPGFGARSYNYSEFLAPGLVIMTTLVSSAWTGGGVIEDLDRGVIDRFLVSPVRRSSIILGRLLVHGILSTVQGLIVLALGFALGARFPGGGRGIVVLITLAVLLSAGISSISAGLALVARRRETLVAAIQFTVLPLTFSSSVLIRKELAPDWIQRVATYNPVNWAAQGGRAALEAPIPWASIGFRVGQMACFALVCTVLATRALRMYQRSI